jgi:error-prone DNA polymerase
VDELWGQINPDRRFGDYTPTPRTAKGFVFLTLEDETGVLNVIVNPGLYDRERITIREPYLLIKGVLQNQSNVVSVKAGE